MQCIRFIFAGNGFFRDMGFFTDKFNDAVCRIKNKKPEDQGHQDFL